MNPPALALTLEAALLPLPKKKTKPTKKKQSTTDQKELKTKPKAGKKITKDNSEE